jgi:hypothetical protein
MNTLCNILTFLFFLTGIGGAIAHQFFLSRLRKLHIRTWDQLGKPVVFLNFGILNIRRFAGFMWRKDYETLPDKKTVAFGGFLRTYFFFSAILGALTVAALICVAWQMKH